MGLLTTLALGATAIVIGVLLLNPAMGLLLLIGCKPIIDTSWEYSRFGMNALQLVATLVPILFIPRILWTRKVWLKSQGLFVVWLLYLFTGLIGVFIMIAHGAWINSFEFFLRIANGFAGFYMLQLYFTDVDRFRRLIIAFLLAGLFPIGMALYQTATGHTWNKRMASGLLRVAGVYHDEFAIRAFSFQTLTAVILYLSYFAKGLSLKKIGVVLLGVCAVFVIFKGYSKAALATLGAWTLIWSFFKRKPWVGVVICGALFVFNYIFGGKILDEVQTVYMKEVGAITGTMDQKFILGGRTGMWQYYIDQWLQADIVFKIFGTGIVGSFHNDYLRVLLTGGLLGLAAYIFLLISIGSKVFSLAFRKATAMSVTALMLFVMWIIDTIGLTPGVFPGYQWFVWGFIGLALHGVTGLDPNNKDIKNGRSKYLSQRTFTGAAKPPETKDHA